MKIERTITVSVTRSEEEQHESKFGKYVTRRSVPDGTKTGVVTLTIDVDELMRTIGSRALYSKSGKSKALSGIVKAVVDKSTVKRVKP